MISLLKKTVSWLVALAGILLAMCGCAVFNNIAQFDWELLAIAFWTLSGSSLLAGSLCAIWRRHTGAKILCIAGVAAGCATHSSGHAEISLFIFASFVFSVPCLFFLITGWLRWPELIGSAEGSRKPLWLSLALFLLLSTVGGFCSLALPENRFEYESERPPFTERENGREAVFTAQILHVGKPRIALWSHYAIARVGRKYWGTPSLFGFVFLRYEFQNDDRGKWFFVYGTHDNGVWTHLLPSVQMSYTASRRLELAQAYVRVLDDGPSPGVRIIGTIVDCVPCSDCMCLRSQPVKGAKVLIEGPTGKRIVVTDAEGVYDAKGLPPGRYAVVLERDSARVIRPQPSEMLQTGRAWGQTLTLSYD